MPIFPIVSLRSSWRPRRAISLPFSRSSSLVPVLPLPSASSCLASTLSAMEHARLSPSLSATSALPRSFPPLCVSSSSALPLSSSRSLACRSLARSLACRSLSALACPLALAVSCTDLTNCLGSGVAITGSSLDPSPSEQMATPRSKLAAGCTGTFCPHAIFARGAALCERALLLRAEVSRPPLSFFSPSALPPPRSLSPFLCPCPSSRPPSTGL